MTGDHRPAGLRFLEFVRARATEPKAWANHDHYLARLSPADYVSLLALLKAWSGVLLIVSDQLALGILLTFLAFGFDKLDGYVAQQTGTASPFGRRIDSFIDVFVYLVPGALVVHYGIAPNTIVSAVIGFLVIGFVGLRLIRTTTKAFRQMSGPAIIGEPPSCIPRSW
ncbi:MAG: CDP-alcohol phosphatidyltransferase family protein [Halobacteriales archaeon]